jgi:hypothetical protein
LADITQARDPAFVSGDVCMRNTLVALPTLVCSFMMFSLFFLKLNRFFFQAGLGS